MCDNRLWLFSDLKQAVYTNFEHVRVVCLYKLLKFFEI